MNQRVGPKHAYRTKYMLLTLSVVLLIAACLGIVWGQGTSSQGLAEEASGNELGEDNVSADMTIFEADEAQQEADLELAREAYAQTEPTASGTCFECHSNMYLLVHNKSGEHYDVSLDYIDESFATSLHGALGCTFCHGGDATAEDAQTAMAGINTKPSAGGDNNVCGQCHMNESESFAKSLHYTTEGLWCQWAERVADLADDLAIEDFASMTYRTESCLDCHVESCGECHVSYAPSFNLELDFTGFIDGHNFVRGDTVEQEAQTCNKCHAAGTLYTHYTTDLHGPNGLDMACTDCHLVSEIHGDGTAYETYHNTTAVKISCESCHDPSELTGEWHSDTHLNANECYACHVTDQYANCYNCHGWFAEENDWEIRYELTLGYADDTGKISNLDHVPVCPEMMGEEFMESIAPGYEITDEIFNNSDTWSSGYTHAAIVPDVTQEFCNRCHGEGTGLLTYEQLQYPDYETYRIVDPLPEVDVSAYLK